MISSTFIRRPRLALVISIVISIAGLIALSVIPVAQFPDIVPPQVQVTATYPGASAAAVEASIGQIVEGQVNGVERMIYMKSTSGGDGSYVLNVSFEVGVDADISTVNVTNRVNRSLALLPPEVQRIGVSVRKQSSSLLQVVAIYSPKGTRDALFLSNYATVNILDTLRRVRGVGEASQFGNQEYSMRIWLGLDRMASLGITEQDVIKALQSQNVQAAVGRVGSAPLIDEVQLQLNISTQGRLTSAEEFGNVIVRAAPDGGIVRISDIARVELGAKTSDSVARYNGREGAGIGIYQAPGANAIATAKAIRKAMDELASRFPDDVAFDVMYDTTVFVQATIEKVIHTLMEAFVLVAIVVFIFLGNLRATLIPIIAVPVALVGTFAVMLAFGFSANTVSLLALVLAIGIVVDDAIVVVEAVEHKLEAQPHLAPAEATEAAMAEVTGPIIAITLVLLSVFVPTAFIPASPGNSTSSSPSPFRLPWSFQPSTRSPCRPLCARCCCATGATQGHHCPHAARHRLEPRRIRRAGAPAGASRHHHGPAGGGFCAGDRRARPHRPDRFCLRKPGRFMGEVQLPDASSLNRTTAVMTQVEGKFMKHPWLQNLFTVTGFSL